MNRETTNRIRFVLEDVLPPVVRDSGLFRTVARLAWGDHITRLARFRERAPFLTAEEYEKLYRDHPRVHEGTDNSEACIEKIIAETVGDSVCDVGCGTGVLLKRIRDARGGNGRYTGVDFVVETRRPFRASTMSRRASRNCRFRTPPSTLSSAPMSSNMCSNTGRRSPNCAGSRESA